jgi:hypothetical protein
MLLVLAPRAHRRYHTTVLSSWLVCRGEEEKRAGAGVEGEMIWWSKKMVRQSYRYFIYVS